MSCSSTFTVWDTSGAADFSQCFEESVLSVLISAAAILFSVFRLSYLRHKKVIEPRLTKWHITANRITSVLSIVASLAALIVASISSNSSGSVTLAASFSLAASIGVAASLYVEHTRLARASTGLMVYWLLAVIVWVIRIRTRFVLEQTDALVYVFIVQAALNAVSFILENMTYVADLETGDRVRPTPLGSNINVFARVTYWYMQPLLVKGAQKELTLDDLWKPDRSQSSSAIINRFQARWKAEIKSATGKGKKPWLIRALLKAFYPALLVGFAEYWVTFICVFIQPMLLDSILGFIADPNGKNYIGYILAAAIFFNAVLNVLMGMQQFITALSVGYQIRSALCTAIFRKSLNLTNTSRQATSTGHINNMLAADTQHVMWYMTAFYDPLGIPVKIAVAIYFLWQQLGVACLAGLGIILLAIPIQAAIGKVLMKKFDEKQSRGDVRIEVVNETLTSIKLLKLYGWDTLFHKRVMNSRQEELKSIKSIGILKSWETLVGSVTPLFVSLASFALYSALNTAPEQALNASRIFVSLSLFNILAEPIMYLGWIFAGGSACYISLNRMQEFLLMEELDDSNVRREIAKDGNVIAVKNGTFKWDAAAEENTLSDINTTVPQGSLTAVIGRVGTGKSSFISSLLGDMHKVSGEVRVSGSVAYVSQQAWIENATIRDNILFGSEYDEKKYQAVIDACALRRDLTLLVSGDMTEIGEKGVNLSGGQKQRLSLARAVYNDAEIYLLDDVLSAVDAHVDKHIFDNVIGPRGMLSGKTRVFVTHGVHHLPSCDKIIVIKDKTIEQQGSYQDLIGQEGTFKVLIEEFAHDVVMEKSDDKSDSKESGEAKDGKLVSVVTDVDVDEKEKEGKLMTKENAGKGLAKASVFVKYIRAAGMSWVILAFVLLVGSQVATVGTSIWLTNWSSGNGTNTTGYYLGIYGLLVIVASVFSLFTNLTMYIKVGQTAARVLHSNMLEGVMNSPMSFFDTNPLGRITNRFVGDMQIVDESLVDTYVAFLTCIAQCISTVVVICSVTPYFLAVILPLIAVYYYLQNYYLKTSQALQRVSRLTNSPIYTLANTTFTGVSTVKAFGKTGKYIEKNNELQDAMQSTFLTSMTVGRWIQFRLEVLGAFISFGAAIFAVVQRNNINAGSAGLSISYALQITAYLYQAMRTFGQFQNNGVSLERIFEYFDLPSEAPQKTGLDDGVALAGWPNEGRVEFKDLKMRYREGTPLVLNGISVDVKGGEKVGIVGRTGAGKSSLSVALFRLSEADEGSIEIDGVDVSKLGLNLLRTKLTIIPQEAVLFGASVRDNIDPGHLYTDDQIWKGLEQKIKSGGENMSVGERQLFCLARAILRKTKILLLDEATAGIDLETDSLIQATIRREFADSTVLTIAHRIQTIMDSDKIMVLNAGRVEEMESPTELMKNPDSAFAQLAAAAGVKEI
ncbi:Canalicular multispecific organic anion transporter 2 [Rhizoclosmatium sp. JEL0117]|nr:Canalicular multispecific organic anion transporter 2 [Rhizoclosmatium sp. JEL0117]